MSGFPYDDAIRILKAHRDEAEREAAAWGYCAVNEAHKGCRYVQSCRGQRAVQKYLLDIFNAAIDFTNQKKREALEAAMERVVGEIEKKPLVERAEGYTCSPNPAVAEVAGEPAEV